MPYVLFSFLSQGSVVDEHEESVISTPRVTPIPSPAVSEKVHVKTPEETITDLEEQSIDETVKSNPSEEKGCQIVFLYKFKCSFSALLMMI